MHTRHPVSDGVVESHSRTLLYISAGASSASGCVQQGFKKASDNQCDSFEQGVCVGKAGQSLQEDALLECSLSVASPALLLLQRAELGANMLVGRLCTFIQWKVLCFGELLHTEPVTAAVADLVLFCSVNE